MTQRPEHNLIYNIMEFLEVPAQSAHIYFVLSASHEINRANRRLAAGRVNRDCDYQQRNRVHRLVPSGNRPLASRALLNDLLTRI